MLSVAKFKTEEEVIEIANDTAYGLGAGLHSSTSRLILLLLHHAGIRLHRPKRPTVLPWKLNFTSAYGRRSSMETARRVHRWSYTTLTITCSAHR